MNGSPSPASGSGALSSRTAPAFDQSLVIAALGVAVGAAIGAALPVTRIEEEWVGPASSSMKQAAQEAARRELDDLKNVASRTRQNLVEAAEDHR